MQKSPPVLCHLPMHEKFETSVVNQWLLNIMIFPSTPQTNAIDCGVFAAAYATEIAAGQMRGIQAPFNVPAIRRHLDCLIQQSLTPFPKVSRGQFGRRRKVIVVEVSEASCDVVM